MGNSDKNNGKKNGNNRTPFGGNPRHAYLASLYIEVAGDLGRATIFWIENEGKNKARETFAGVEEHLNFAYDMRVRSAKKRAAAARAKAEEELSQLTSERARNAARPAIYETHGVGELEEAVRQAEQKFDRFRDRMDSFTEAEQLAAELADKVAADLAAQTAAA